MKQLASALPLNLGICRYQQIVFGKFVKMFQPLTKKQFLTCGGQASSNEEGSLTSLRGHFFFVIEC
jgi:hypothetical protein